jgi:hypothetical protein
MMLERAPFMKEKAITPMSITIEVKILSRFVDVPMSP